MDITGNIVLCSVMMRRYLRLAAALGHSGESGENEAGAARNDLEGANDHELSLDTIIEACLQTRVVEPLHDHLYDNVPPRCSAAVCVSCLGCLC